MEKDLFKRLEGLYSLKSDTYILVLIYRIDI